MKKTAKKAKEAKNRISSEISSQNLNDQSAGSGKVTPVKLRKFLQEALDAINKDPVATKALRTLREIGCDQKYLLELLHAYCGGTREQSAKWMKLAREFRDRLKRDADRLRKSAELIDGIKKGTYEPMADTRYHEPGDTAGDVRFLAELLAAEAKGYDENLKGARPNRKGIISSGRTSNLEELVMLIEVSKVSGNPYLLIAPLVAAVRKDVERNYAKLSDRLRKAVERSKVRRARAAEKSSKQSRG